MNPRFAVHSDNNNNHKHHNIRGSLTCKVYESSTAPGYLAGTLHISYGADDGGFGLGKVGPEELVQFKGGQPYALQSDREAESPLPRFCQNLLGGSPLTCE